MVFVETSVFTKRIMRLGLEDAVRGLQLELLENPAAGDLDPGTGGLRKVRMADPTRGRASAAARECITCGCRTET